MLGSTHSNDLLNLIYKATAIANMADNAATSPLTNLYFALHSSWPGAGGSQNTNEVAYTSYARVAVARGAGFTVTSNQVSPAATVNFPPATGGSATAYFFSVGTASSGAGKILDVGVIGAGPKIGVGLTSDTVNAPGHGLAVNDPVILWAALGNSLPTGLTEGTVYYVKTAPDADNITLSATQGGTTLDITGIGAGILQKLTPISVTTGVTPQLTTATVITRQ